MLLCFCRVLHHVFPLSTSQVEMTVCGGRSGVAAGISLYGFWSGRKYYKGAQLRFLNGAIAAAMGYIIYMVTIDIPNYYVSWSADQTIEKAYNSLSEGFTQLCSYWVYTRSYSDWQYELLWMPLYFGGAVWSSIFIVNTIRLDQTNKAD